MLDNNTFELINAGLDRELGPAETEQLDALLESSAEARAVRSELLKLCNVLDTAPELTPTVGLSEQILGQVKIPSPRRMFSLAGLFSSLQPAAVGLSFAAGLLLAIGVYELSPGTTSDGDLATMVGTMVAGKESTTTHQLDAFSIDQSGLFGTVSLSETQGVLVLDFVLDSTQQVEIQLDLAKTGLKFAGIAQAANLPEDMTESYRVSGGALRVVNQGRQSFTIFLRSAASDRGGEGIGIEFSSGGERVFQGILRG